MKKSLIANLASFTSLFVLSAVMVYAQTAGQSTSVAQDVESGIDTVGGLIDRFTKSIVKNTGVLLLSLGVVAFFWGVVQYVWGVRNAKPDVIKDGNNFMIYGLIGLFVMFSVYGIIKFGQGILFGGKDVSSIVIPEINFKGSGSAPITNPGGSTPGSAPLTTPGGATPGSSPVVSPGGAGAAGGSAGGSSAGSGGGANYDSRITGVAVTCSNYDTDATCPSSSCIWDRDQGCIDK